MEISCWGGQFCLIGCTPTANLRWVSGQSNKPHVGWHEVRTTKLTSEGMGQLMDQVVEQSVRTRPQIKIGNHSSNHVWMSLVLPCLEASSSNFWMIFCFTKEISSISTVVMYLWLEANFDKGKSQGVTWSRDTPLGGGMQAKASKIVILCYFPSIFYLINYCKNIQNIKNCQALPTPPARGGVWCDTLAVKS